MCTLGKSLVWKPMLHLLCSDSPSLASFVSRRSLIQRAMSADKDTSHELFVLIGDKPANLCLTSTHVSIISEHHHSSILSASTSKALSIAGRPSTRSFPYVQVLNAAFNPQTLSLQIKFLSLQDSLTKLPFISASVNAEHAASAEAFVSELMKRAYGEVKPYKRLKVLLNPKSGKGKGRAIWVSLDKYKAGNTHACERPQKSALF